MLNNNFNFHTPWDSQNPYNLRLNKKQAFSACSKKNENNNFQHYNILSAYEVNDETSIDETSIDETSIDETSIDETSINKTYVSLVFYHAVRLRKILVKKELQILFSEGG
jgi:hypothetical protein